MARKRKLESKQHPITAQPEPAPATSENTVKFAASRAKGAGKVWPYVLLAGLTLLFFWDSFFAGKALLMRDYFFDCHPWRLFARQALRAGHLPFWNPFSLCGQPYLANTQTAVFYPLHALYILLPPLFAMKLWLALHLLIAAAGMYALGRHWRLERGPVLLAGVAFAFSTHVIAMLEFQGAVPAIVGTPLAVLLAGKLFDAAGTPPEPSLPRKMRWWIPRSLMQWTALLTLFYTTEFLAGHLQSFINALLIVLIYLAVRCAAQWRLERVARCAAAFGAAGALTIGLCLPQLLLTLELMPLSLRGVGMDPDMAKASLHPIWLLGGLLPFLGGRAGHFGQWWGEAHTMFEFWASALYIGIPALVFLAAAPFNLLRRDPQPAGLGATRRVQTLAMLAVLAFGLLMAMGQYTPAYKFFYDHVPVFDKLRWPSKFLQLVVFAAAALAGLGFQAFLDSKPLRRSLTACALGLFAVMLLATVRAETHPEFFTWLTGGAFHHNPERPELFAGLVRDWNLALLFLGLTLAALLPFALGRAEVKWRGPAQLALVLVAFLNLFVIGRQVHPIVGDSLYLTQPEPEIARPSREEPSRIDSTYLRDAQMNLYGLGDPALYRYFTRALLGEIPSLSGIFHISGGDVLQLASYHQLSDILDLPDEYGEQKNRILSLFNMRRIIQGPPLEELISGKIPEQLSIVDNPMALPRALVMENWAVVPTEKEAQHILVQPDFDPYRIVLLAHPPEGWPAESMAVPPQPGKPRGSLAEAGVESVKYDWNRIDVVASSRRPSMLFLSEVDYPGWEATVDGKPEKIVRADLAFRAVRLPETGRHTVSFVYRPRRFTVGLFGGAIGLFLLCGLAAWEPLRRRRTERKTIAS